MRGCIERRGLGRALNRSLASALPRTLVLLLVLGSAPVPGPATDASAQIPPAPLREDPPEPHNCRLWALIGHDYPDTLLRDQLQVGSITSLRELGGSNRDGWGFAYDPGERWQMPFSGFLYRRGGPQANDPYDPDYDLAVEELVAVRPTAIVGHVRAGTSGHFDLPDPHPFLHPRASDRTMAFAHNGGVEESILLAMIGDYLDTHPLEYTEGLPGSGPIDSELLFVYLLKYKDEHPELASFSEAIPPAIREVIKETGSSSLNVTMTQGDTLYAIATFPLSYYPRSVAAGDLPSPYWVVASQVMGSTALGWGTIASGTLGVFAPDAAPRFLSLQQGPSEEGARMRGAAPRVPAEDREAGSGEGAAPVEAGGAVSRDPDPAAEDHNCRFWALVGEDYPSGMIEDQLRDGTIQNLKTLGGANDDGWGIGYFLRDWSAQPFTHPIVRRGGPRANHPHAPGFDRTVNELRLFRPRAAIGHVRRGTSGHLGIPDPHPFLDRHPRRDEGLLFAHNGSLDVYALGQRLGAAYLLQHPPDYGSPTPLDTKHIDSELYLLYLLKLIEARPDLPFAEALLEAARTISRDDEVTDLNPRMNFVLTEGDTLYALNYYGLGNANPICYWPPLPPDGVSFPPFWVAASESLGSVNGWTALPAQTLAVFVPGEAPRLLPIEEPAEPQFSFGWVTVTTEEDADGDGYASRIRVCADPNVDQGSWTVSMSLFVSPAGENAWGSGLHTRAATITGGEPDTLCLTRYAFPDTLAPTEWDARVTLTEYSSGDTVLVVTPESHPQWGLGGLKVEGVLQDLPLPPGPRIAFERVVRSAAVDLDGDGYARAFTIEWDADLVAERGASSDGGAVAGGVASEPDSVRVEVFVRALEDGEETTLGSSGEYWLKGEEDEGAAFAVTVPEDLAPGTWDLRLDLYAAEPDTLAASAAAETFPALDAVAVEGAAADDPGSVDSLATRLVAVRPNPSGGSLAFVFEVAPGGARAEIRIRDVAGRLVHREGPLSLADGEREIAWDGRDDRGHAVATGIYLCEIRLDGRSATRRAVLVR